MKIELLNPTVRDVVNGYLNSDEEGVVGYGGKLNIRPKYQREFVYLRKQQEDVIRTIKDGLPLNVMYWCKTEGGFELMDGQQRTLSFCSYIQNDFSVDDAYFGNLPKDIQDKILDYKLFIYVCEGTESEKLKWFRIINIAGEKLTDQELRNAVYAGSWVSDAKRYFSKRGCAARGLAEKYVKGDAIRQELLEKAIKWVADKEGKTIEAYMAEHQHDANALALWNNFRSAIDWVKATFPTYRKEMLGVDWGKLYNEFGDDRTLDATKLEARIKELMEDDDVTSKKGIYPYVLTGDERSLSIRAFKPKEKREVFERQNHKCKKCGKVCELEQMEADHITPWSQGGKTVIENCQMLCKDCNRRKSDK